MVGWIISDTSKQFTIMIVWRKLCTYSCESEKGIISEQHHIVERSDYIERIVLEIRFCRATLKVWPVKWNLFFLFKEIVMPFVTNIITCPWHLLTSIWKYSVISIIAESLAIWSIHKSLEYSRSGKGDQLETDRSQSFCLLQSVCYNYTEMHVSGLCLSSVYIFTDWFWNSVHWQSTVSSNSAHA